MGLKVTYNSDIFEKLIPSPMGFKCPNLNLKDIYGVFGPPSPYFGKTPKIFPFFKYDASPKSTDPNVHLGDYTKSIESKFQN